MTIDATLSRCRALALGEREQRARPPIGDSPLLCTSSTAVTTVMTNSCANVSDRLTGWIASSWTIGCPVSHEDIKQLASSRQFPISVPVINVPPLHA